ncbi:tetratricopeptide repeat protein [Sulfurirhabdus autotrophica]|uniref:Tetratricopeptide repeat protein n=1 Tax=Sulfurirhabdus autotrophica TaxID=1706046 RepID=A0A4R3Y771_9PROT|nr:tetratricopeptide repeat protein [Sulfurirhabdus autotrophica]TCV88135.1 tetratricopeptide repeat protein [Sulfurirhabdus autotrophica]
MKLISKYCHLKLQQIVKLSAITLQRFILLTLMVIAIGYTISATAEGFLPDKREILMMPQLCQWMYGARAGLDPSAVPQSHTMDTTGCTRYHYYCDAHTDLVRAEKNAYTNPGLAKEKLNRALNTLKGQIEFHDGEGSCSKYLRADIRYTYGKALERYARLTKSSNYYAEAISPLLQAIQLTPEDFRAYQVLGDVYTALNKRKEAQEILYNGLEINPDSKALLRRYKAVGGQRPIPEKKSDIPPETVNTEKPGKPDTTEEPAKTQDTPAKPSEPLSVSKDASTSGTGVQGAESKNPQDNSQSSPYCRFCPDLGSDQNTDTTTSPVDSVNAETNKPACRFCP